MNLKTLIKELKKIEAKFGGEAEVTMADNIPAVEPVYLNGESGRQVVITDEK
ncbi:MAG: hypothetical protein Q8P76_00500 [bacterium]|nr:hypothetical protein [bacterium]